MGHSHLHCARKRQADHGDRADEHADCDELAFAIAHCMPHLRSSPERSLRSACNERRQPTRQREETTSANVVRNLPASVSGRPCIVWSSGTGTVGRRIATGSSEGNLPGGFASLCRQCDTGEFVRVEWYFFRVARTAMVPGALHLLDFSVVSTPTSWAMPGRATGFMRMDGSNARLRTARSTCPRCTGCKY